MTEYYLMLFVKILIGASVGAIFVYFVSKKQRSLEI